MVYTVQFDIFINKDEICSDDEIKDIIDLALESVSCDAKNIEVISVGIPRELFQRKGK